MISFASSHLSLAAFGLAVVYELGWIIYCRYFHPLRFVPGPFVASVSRLWAVYHASNGNMEHIQRSLHKKYGYLVRIAPNEVIVSDPGAIKIIYGIKSEFTKSDFYDAWAAPNEIGYPGHFPSRDEKLHTEHRRLVNHVYSMSSVLDSEMNIDSCTHLLTEAIQTSARQATIVNLGLLLNMYAFDVLGELFYGQTFGMIETRSDVGGYMESIESLLPIFTIGGTLPSWLTPIYLIYKISFSASLRGAINATKRITIASQEAIQRRSRELADHSNNKPDILRKMLEIVADRGAKVKFTTKHILVESQSSLFAGADTTSIALTSVLYYLMRHPVVYRKLVAEIDTAFTTGQLSNPVTYKEATTALPYLKACINEAMRLHPGVGFHLPRVTPLAGATICGVYIPSGYHVGVNPAVVQYDQGIFGPDAEHFNPDRWLGSNAVEMERIMMPFGAGSRTCIGKHIALCQVYKLVPQLLRKFNVRLVREKEWETRNFWFNKPVDIMVVFEERDKQKGRE
ncbi:cytochrome P450 [Aspergillus stella-maris]|uniref:cytochrome P450 n=1 Tax=Aspergillus stella-maris TaxID=1810926 RepID=UPI003CCE3562